jgi:hypothetical protein
MVELEAAKIARVEAEGAKREALAEKEAANREKEAVTREKEAVTREKEAVTLLAESLRGEKEAVREAAQCEVELLRRENESLRASSGNTEEAVKRALDAQKERLEREAAQAKYERDQRTIWLRSPECVLTVWVITAQNGYSAHGFKNLSRAFRYDEQLWDAIKDRCGPNGNTHLMVASWKGDVERVRWLLKRSANVNAARTENGSTALMFASSLDEPEKSTIEDILLMYKNNELISVITSPVGEGGISLKRISTVNANTVDPHGNISTQ